MLLCAKMARTQERSLASILRISNRGGSWSRLDWAMLLDDVGMRWTDVISCG